MTKLHQSGFTLIELLVVVALIGVLTAVLLANMVGIRERGADTKVKNDLNQLKTALRMYYNDYQTYPTGSGACLDVLPINAEGAFASGSNIYIKEIPANCNYSSSTSESFLLSAELDNEGDQDAAQSADRCGAAAQPGVYFVCLD